MCDIETWEGYGGGKRLAKVVWRLYRELADEKEEGLPQSCIKHGVLRFGDDGRAYDINEYNV